MTETISADLASAIAKSAGLLRGRSICVLTGAGISTDSGIPAYRGEGVPARTDPMTGQVYRSDELARRRYWLGGHLGWSTFAAAAPNAAHDALAVMERGGVVSGVTTQNVDGLHLRAGSSRVIELHGTMHRVLCLDCGQMFDRREVADELERLNPWVALPDRVQLNPDGDVSPASVEDFIVPACTVCGGMLKPDVVFFGEFVPAGRFRAAESLLRASDALIIAGSSLVVNSGVRLVERARRRGIPIIIINREPTRADPWADAVLTGGTGVVLPILQEMLT